MCVFVSTQERQMSRFADGQLCLVTAEVLANIFDRKEQEGRKERSGCCQGEIEETGEQRAGRVRGGHKKRGRQ